MTYSEPDIADVDYIEGIIFVPQTVEDISNLESTVSVVEG
jgi:hypothetical protein